MKRFRNSSACLNCYEIEGLTVVDMMRQESINLFTFSLNDQSQVTGSYGITVKIDGTMADVDHDVAKMLVLPSGIPGTNHLATNVDLGKMFQRAAADNKYVAAICAALSVLGGLGLLAAKKPPAIPGLKAISLHYKKCGYGRAYGDKQKHGHCH